MDGLGHLKEGVVRRDDAPVCLQAKIALDRHDGAQELGNAAAERCGVEVEHLKAVERGGERAKLGDRVVAEDCCIGLDVQVAQINGMKHET